MPPVAPSCRAGAGESEQPASQVPAALLLCTNTGRTVRTMSGDHSLPGTVVEAWVTFQWASSMQKPEPHMPAHRPQHVSSRDLGRKATRPSASSSAQEGGLPFLAMWAESPDPSQQPSRQAEHTDRVQQGTRSCMGSWPSWVAVRTHGGEWGPSFLTPLSPGMGEDPVRKPFGCL